MGEDFMGYEIFCNSKVEEDLGWPGERNELATI